VLCSAELLKRKEQQQKILKCFSFDDNFKDDIKNLANKYI
jgi:hypothetical protein